MSKYLGKLLLENGYLNWVDLSVVLVRYFKGAKRYIFKCGEYTFYMGEELSLRVVSLGVCELDFQYEFSVGYKVRKKKGVNFLNELKAQELEVVGGRKSLLISGEMESDDSYEVFSALEYKYNLSKRLLLDIKRHAKKSKGYIRLSAKSDTKRGRKLGGKNSCSVLGNEGESESVDEICERVNHNKKVAVSKGILDWYLEAEKELCQVLNKSFDKDLAIKEWQKERQKM